ncbi:prepilin-type N-terminal cleavage/methylation domain-containing protein [Candidatus Curtissbacteria bacterium]|nr:prepilin-type N-terminal cleavage/methylation domain-containing protein [Candidatus Curtissbacteria bacterium]
MNKAVLRLKNRLGFTLIEVLVVVGILGILITLVIVAVNPARQLQQTRNTQRASDLKAVQTALEAYRVANNIYPLSTVDNQITGAPWGEDWSGYLSNVPQDPTDGHTYSYVSTDGTNYQLYADFEGTPPESLACGAGCGPNGTFDAGVSSGNSSLQTFTPAPTPTPSPTPIPLPAGKVSYFGSSSSYPRVIQVDFDPLDVSNGGQQILTIKAWSDFPITAVSAYYILDGTTSEVYQLDQTSAALNNGVYKDVWAKTITVNGTHNTNYELHMTVTDSNGGTVSPVIQIK